MKWKKFMRDDRGVTYTEFGLLGVLLSIAAVFFFTDMGPQIVDTYAGVSHESYREL